MKYPIGRPSIGAAEIAAVVQTLAHGRLTQGEGVRAFEEAFAQYVGVKHAVMCSSGTAALHLALVALGIGAGDEVLVPDLSYVATANAVKYTGATPVLVDVEDETWTMNVQEATKKVTPQTKAAIPVHLYGVPCGRIDGGFDIIEDASEGLGCDGLGTHGVCGTFSFYANKIMTTGEGGAVVTNDETLAETLRFFRGQAVSREHRFWHSEVGFNYRMTDIAAAIGLAQLARLSEFLTERQRVIDGYHHALPDLQTSLCHGDAPWLYTCLLPDGVSFERVERSMNLAGIEVRPVFVPMHRLPMYTQPEELFPVASRIADRGISLPTYPDITDDDVRCIATTLQESIHAAL